MGVGDCHMNHFKDTVKRAIRTMLRTIPFARRRLERLERAERLVFLSGFEPGHYYSPIPDLEEVALDADRVFGDRAVAGVDLNVDAQWRLMHALAAYYPEYPYARVDADSSSALRYRKAGAYYRYADSVLLYAMMRHVRPQRIIEVGSGHSSAIMLDTNEQFLDGAVRFTFIDPNPDRLHAILRPTDTAVHALLQQRVQSVALDTFAALQANDVLFIDSSHVSKVGSDLNYLLFEVLPVLKPGVLIHFHDIFHPFEMPREWVTRNRWYWNENYLLHAFLMHNTAYEIVAFNSYLLKQDPAWFRKAMPECLVGSDETGCLWLRKLA
jgi:predicted O-methyltransferase YrrM